MSIGILLRVLPFVILAGALWWGWIRLDNWCNSACVEQKEHVSSLESSIKVAQERATALALLWAEAVQKVEVRYVEVVKERKSVFAGIRERAGRIGTATASIAVPVPADAARVLADASRAANAAADPGEHQEPSEAVPAASGDTTLGEVIERWTEAAEAYADAREKHLACLAYVGVIHSKVEEAWGPSSQQPSE